MGERQPCLGSRKPPGCRRLASGCRRLASGCRRLASGCRRRRASLTWGSGAPCVSDASWGGLFSPSGSPRCSHPYKPPWGLARASRAGNTRAQRTTLGHRRARLRPDLAECSLQPAPPVNFGLRESHTPCSGHISRERRVQGVLLGVCVAECRSLQKPGRTS